MGIGASVFMLALGAIITFAFNVRVGWLDLDVVGWVLMAAGAIGLILTLTVFGRRRSTTVVESAPTTPAYDPRYDQGAATHRVVEERSTYDADRPL
jgi:Domain of unknown function (DUF6458)